MLVITTTTTTTTTTTATTATTATAATGNKRKNANRLTRRTQLLGDGGRRPSPADEEQLTTEAQKYESANGMGTQTTGRA